MFYLADTVMSMDVYQYGFLTTWREIRDKVRLEVIL